MATLGRSGDVDAGRAVRARARGGAEGRRHHARLRAGARHPHQPEESGDRRSRARGASRGGRAARQPRSSARCRRRASPPAASTFPGTATPAPTRISSCRSSSIRPIGSARVEFVPFRAAIEAGVATIMTAHVLVPALDEERPATLSRRIVTGLLRDELRLRGRDPQRRSRDEGDRDALRGARGGRAGDRRRAATAC